MNSTANYSTWSWRIHETLFIQSTHFISIGFWVDGTLHDPEQFQECPSPVANPPKDSPNLHEEAHSLPAKGRHQFDISFQSQTAVTWIRVSFWTNVGNNSITITKENMLQNPQSSFLFKMLLS